MSTIHALPNELIDLVLSHLRTSPSELDFAGESFKAVRENESLLPAALVCRRWAPVAQRCLWDDMRMVVRIGQDLRERDANIQTYPVATLWLSLEKSVAMAGIVVAARAVEDALQPLVGLKSLYVARTFPQAALGLSSLSGKASCLCTEPLLSRFVAASVDPPQCPRPRTGHVNTSLQSPTRPHKPHSPH